MRAQVLLCDYAQVADGKLFITGGGISRITGLGLPPGFTVAALIQIPWNETNRPVPFTLDLVDQDSQPVTDPMGLEIRVSGNIEVGRPPGLEQGIPIEHPMAITASGIPLPPGRYTWRLYLDEQTREEWQQAFTMLPTPGVSP